MLEILVFDDIRFPHPSTVHSEQSGNDKINSNVDFKKAFKNMGTLATFFHHFFFKRRQLFVTSCFFPWVTQPFHIGVCS